MKSQILNEKVFKRNFNFVITLKNKKNLKLTINWKNTNLVEHSQF